MGVIADHHYKQLHDYLTQVLDFSSKEGLPKITQKSIADQLFVDSSIISKFLRKRCFRPQRALTNFIQHYSAEFRRWPSEVEKIQRAITALDVFEFLHIPPPQQQAPTLAPPAPRRRERADEVLAVVETPQRGPVVSLVSQRCERSSIVISYRGHQTIKDGQGMVFDHMAIQLQIGYVTKVAYPNEEIQRAQGVFQSAVRGHPASLPYGTPTEDGHRLPKISQSTYEDGLLIIPGRVHKVEDEPIRLCHEYLVIRDALNRGQPIMGLCAGAWRVFEQALIWSTAPSQMNLNAQMLSEQHKKKQTLLELKDHNYGGGMVRLDRAFGNRVTYNVQIHDVVISKNSHVQDIMKVEANHQMTVNSVHWKAVNAQRMPPNMKVCALSVQNLSLEKKLRQGNLMRPEENAVEAFEWSHGAPIIGCQWHPEAYSKGTSHARLLEYMAKAGDAYTAKRRMLRELAVAKIAS